MKVGIVVFPGSNCDRDMQHVLTDVFKLNTELLWHEHELSKNLDAIVLPGGFSYGDRLRAGVIAAHSPVINGIKKMAERGTSELFLSVTETLRARSLSVTKPIVFPSFTTTRQLTCFSANKSATSFAVLSCSMVITL